MRPLHWALWWVLGGALLFALIVYACLRPPGGMTPWLPRLDKLQHAGALFVLSFWCLAVVERRAYLRVTLVMIAVGAGIEVAQGLMALGRSAEWLDFLADVVGILLALGVSLVQRESWFAKVETWMQPN
jgi:VanZ family protein